MPGWHWTMPAKPLHEQPKMTAYYNSSIRCAEQDWDTARRRVPNEMDVFHFSSQAGNAVA